MAPSQSSSGGIKGQGKILPGSGGDLASPPPARSHPPRDQGPDNSRMWRRTQVGRVRGIEAQSDLRQVNPPGSDMDVGAGAGTGGGKKRGGSTVMVTEADAGMQRGAQTSVGGWGVAGAGGIKVGGASLQERRWGAVANERIL